MKIYYRMMKAGKEENKYLTNYQTCCEKNVNAVFADNLKLNRIGPVQEWAIHFRNYPINNCPYCGAKIEIIKE